MASTPLEFSSIPVTAQLQPDPFTVSIPETSIVELKTLLKASRVAPRTYESSFKDRRYGLTSEWVMKAKHHWETEFDWRKTEVHINSFPQFIAPIVDDDGMSYKIHFAALFSKKSNAIPVILLHGWPGSFLEFLPILQLISARYKPSELPYHMIVPSLPGYGFSSPPPLNRDFQLQDIARLFNKLMVGLGFGDGYVVQGGDVGSKVARVMAAEQANCKAVHINFCYMPEPKGVDLASVNEAERIGLERGSTFSRTGSAYALEHATRPATLGFVLGSNPLALLAWIGEKFMDWTDEDPSIDTVLDSVSLYWFTDTIATTLYPYRQLFTPGQIGAHENPIWYITKPFGFSWFPKEIAPVPRAWAATTGDLIFYRQHPKGGHFAAVEHPDVLLQDLEDFIVQVWPVAGS
ncbi:Alpha/Beta hydrolase protein [Mycena floridula]|nr:Alpha/Beta hydrolase protein [Mycena floridula]